MVPEFDKNVTQLNNIENNESALFMYKKRFSHDNSDWQNLYWKDIYTMMKNFAMVDMSVHWDYVTSWLDLGCGMGNLFEYIDRPDIEKVGIDATDAFIKNANERDIKNAKFYIENILSYMPKEKFDLITVVGVWQNFNRTQRSEIAKKLINCVKHNGRIVINTLPIIYNGGEMDRPFKRFGAEISTIHNRNSITTIYNNFER